VQLRGEQLPAHLERDIKPIYTIYGDEPLLVIEAADTIRAAARQRGFAEREVLTAIAGFNWNDLHHASGSMSLFGERKLIDLRIPTGKPGREGSAALQDYCARPSPDALLLATLPGLDWTEGKGRSGSRRSLKRV
jgi:DNA polymerase III, delta subunit (EC 2.7.7.7)